MKKNITLFVGFLFVVLLLINTSGIASAHEYSKDVLGEATTASTLIFPPVTSGPGYLLPDSPLYFLDQWTQAIRIFASADSKSKIKMRTQIAGERMAELRIMFARNNAVGINTALFGMTSEMQQATQDLSELASLGGDVKKLAEDLNEVIKTQRNTLDILADQSNGSLQLELKAARRSLQESKVVVEDNLSEEELWKEIDETMTSNAVENLTEAGNLAKKLQLDLDRLNIMATQAAGKTLARRQNALQMAIDAKNTELIAQQKKLLEVESAKQNKILTAQKAVSTESTRALGQTIQAVESLQKAQEVVNALKK